MEGDEPREAGIREGEALHEEALLVPVGAGHLVCHLVLAQHVPVGLTRVLGTWEGKKRVALTPQGAQGAGRMEEGLCNLTEKPKPGNSPTLPFPPARREKCLIISKGKARGKGRSFLRLPFRCFGWQFGGI